MASAASSFLTGLALRFFLFDISYRGKLGPVFLGIWEGVVLHHFRHKFPFSYNPYFSCCLRLLADCYFTASVSRLLATVVWVALAGLVSELYSHEPDVEWDRRPKRTDRRPRRVRIDAPASLNPPPLTIRLPSPTPRITTPLEGRTHRPPYPSTMSTAEASKSPIRLIIPRPPSAIEPVPEIPSRPLTVSGDELPDGHSSVSIPQAMVPEEVSRVGDTLVPLIPLDASGADVPLMVAPWPPSPISEVDELATPRLSPGDPETYSDNDELQTPIVFARELSSHSHLDVLSDAEHTSRHEVELPIRPDTPEPLPVASSSNIIQFPAFGIVAPTVLDLSAPFDEIISIAESLESQAEVESIISAGNARQISAKAEALRKEAWAEKEVKVRLEEAHRQAIREGRESDAFLLRGDIQECEERMKALHKRAERRYFHALNASQNVQKQIDVHGLFADEALHRTEKALRDNLRSGLNSLRVVVGKGNHSAKGPVLKPYIRREMMRQKINCIVDPHNAGVLILSLPQT